MALTILSKWRSLNYVRILIVCGSICVTGIVLGFLIIPTIINVVISKTISLRPGTLSRQIYQKVPFPVTIKIYVFHVQNAVDVTKGAKPRLQEIGPLYFDEFKEKYDMLDNKKEDSLEFEMKNTFIFRPDLSKGLTGNEVVTIAHPLIMGMALGANIEYKQLLGMVSKAIDTMFHSPSTPFWTGRVMDLLFDGIDIDCSSTSFEAKATCSVLMDLENIRVVNEKLLKFSILGNINASSVGKYKVRRGVKNIKDLGRMITFNDQESLDVWGSDGDCNQFRGTDSTIFPPRLKTHEGMWAFEPSICLSVGATYVGPSQYAGIPTREYSLDFGNISKDEHRHCYCLDPPMKCPRAGTIGMYQCNKAPLVISLPHFYKADPEILTHIESGLSPNKAEHGVFAHYEYRSGTPVSGAKRLQFSMDVVAVPEVECMKNVPELLLPMFWLEESLNLNKTYTNLLKNQLFLALKIISIIKWSMIAIGATGFTAAAFLHSRKIAVRRAVKPATADVEMETTDSMGGEVVYTTPTSAETKHDDENNCFNIDVSEERKYYNYTSHNAMDNNFKFDENEHEHHTEY